MRRIRRQEQDNAPASPPPKDQLGPCWVCRDAGGITVRGRAMPPQEAIIHPRHSVGAEGTNSTHRNSQDDPMRPAVPVPMCGYHVELAAWERDGKPRGYPAPHWTSPLTESEKKRADELLPFDIVEGVLTKVVKPLPKKYEDAESVARAIYDSEQERKANASRPNPLEDFGDIPF